MSETKQSPNPNNDELLNLIYKEVLEIKKTVIQTNSSEGFIDIETVCQSFKISKKTLRRYREQRLIPYHKIKGKVYFLESEVREALKKHYYGG